MAESGDAVLNAIQELGTRFDQRFEAIDRRFDAIDRRFDAVDQRMFQQDVELRDTRERLDQLEKHVADVCVRLDEWPDLRLLASTARTTLERLRVVGEDVRDVRARLGEIYSSMATDPEVHGLRDEVRRFHETELDREIRIRRLEAEVLDEARRRGSSRPGPPRGGAGRGRPSAPPGDRRRASPGAAGTWS